MGLDMKVVMAKNRKQLENPKFWDECATGFVKDEEGCVDFSKPAEVLYWRKFWPLYEAMSKRLHLENGEYGELSKDDIEFMLNFACHNTDYWGDFNTVPQICELLQQYDWAREQGMAFFFEGDY